MTRKTRRGSLSLAAFVLLASLFSTDSLPAQSGSASGLFRDDFDGDGRTDLLSVRPGDETLLLSPDDGEGGFLAPRPRALPGRVTAVAVGEVNRRDGLSDIAVAIVGPDGPAVLIFGSPTGAFDAEVERFALPAVAKSMVFGRFDDDPYRDLAVVIGEEALIIHGRERGLSWQAPIPALPARVQQLALESLKGPAERLSVPKKGGGLFTVDSSGDGPDLIPGDGMCEAAGDSCTLRAAIMEANVTAGLDTINFAGSVTAPIGLGSSLGVSDPVIIDGTSHPDFAGSPVVVLDAGDLGGGSAIDLMGGSDGSTLSALVIHGAPEAGVKISDSGGNTIAGCYIGTDASGTTALANGAGIKIVGSSADNSIGGTAPGAGNLISGNTSDGIELEISAAITGTRIEGNLIGTDAAGLSPLGNGEHGVHVGSPSGTIGGTSPGAKNIIAFNGMHGIFLLDDDNLVQGNWIGVAADGSAAGNLIDGVHLGPPGSAASTIGGTVPGAGNVISGNVRDGIRFRIGADNVVQGNLIGTDPTGLLDRGNGGFGICDGCVGGFRNIIGGTAAGAGNVISANTLDGYATGTFDSVVQGNIIGLGADGETVLGNGGAGIGGSDTVVGGSDPLAGNLVSGNFASGVRIGTDAIVMGNRIGVTASGGVAGNGSHGVRVLGTRVALGGTATGEGNVIAHNSGDGVAVTDVGLINTISGNSIFDNLGLGIDLDDDGVTANDPGDSDVGTNDLQNFPVLTAADGGLGTVSGVLDGGGGLTHVIEVFSSPDCDPSGHGEGKVYLGSGMVTTSGSGDVAFMVTTAPFVVGVSITATATNPGGSTSEFSACIEATSTEVPIFSDGFESGDTSAWSSTTS